MNLFDSPSGVKTSVYERFAADVKSESITKAVHFRKNIFSLINMCIQCSKYQVTSYSALFAPGLEPSDLLHFGCKPAARSVA